VEGLKRGWSAGLGTLAGTGLVSKRLTVVVRFLRFLKLHAVPKTHFRNLDQFGKCRRFDESDPVNTAKSGE
jgi:hypothetical protein